VLGLGRAIGMAAMGFGCSLVAFSLSHWLWLSILFMAWAGYCQITQMASGNTVLQTLVDDEKRGRVMSFFMMSFMGMMPLGSLIYGSLSQPTVLGPQLTVRIGGVLVFIAGAVFASQLWRIRGVVRSIYVEKGILPPVAAGLQAAAAVRQVEGE
jgi:MFS family permease